METALPEDEDVVEGELVVVRLGGSRFAIDMAAVAEVGRPPGLTRIPNTPAWVAGLVNWRGRVLAVVDLRPSLGAASEGLDRRGRLVVLRRDGVSVGLLAESVDGTRPFSATPLEPVLANLAESGAGLLSGQLTDAEGPIGVLDLDAVFGLADSLPRPRRSVTAPV